MTQQQPLVRIQRVGGSTEYGPKIFMRFMVSVDGVLIKTMTVIGRHAPEGQDVTHPQGTATTISAKRDMMEYWYYLPKLAEVVLAAYQRGGIPAVDAIGDVDMFDTPFPAELAFPLPEHAWPAFPLYRD
jgi:hypothetical protein